VAGQFVVLRRLLAAGRGRRSAMSTSFVSLRDGKGSLGTVVSNMIAFITAKVVFRSPFVRSSNNFVGRYMGLAVLRAYPGAGSAADAAAGVIDNHDRATELASEVVVLAIAGPEDLTGFVDAVQMHDLARADLEAAAATNARHGVNGRQILRHPCGAVAGNEMTCHRWFSNQDLSLRIRHRQKSKISSEIGRDLIRHIRRNSGLVGRLFGGGLLVSGHCKDLARHFEPRPVERSRQRDRCAWGGVVPLPDVGSPGEMRAGGSSSPRSTVNRATWVRGWRLSLRSPASFLLED